MKNAEAIVAVLSRLLAIDRRIIFLVIAAAIILSLFFPMRLEVAVTPPAKSIYETIESLPSGSVVLVSSDYDPASKPELYPMTVALLRHCFRKNLKVVAMTLWVTGEGLVADALSAALKDEKFKDKKEGEDYVFLGAKVGGSAVVMGMGQDIAQTFPKDHKKTPVSSLPLMRNLKTLSDFDYAVVIAAGVPGIDDWVVYGSEYFRKKKPKKVELGAGCTGVMAAQYYPYLDSGQINGLLGGMKGAAEYESLINYKDQGTNQMDAESITHVIIIAFVILGNIAYFITRKSKGKKVGEAE
jgi:hypothetical protein